MSSITGKRRVGASSTKKPRTEAEREREPTAPNSPTKSTSKTATKQPKKKKRKTSVQAEEEEDPPSESEIPPEDDMEALASLESSILSSDPSDSVAQHFNSIVKIMAIAEKLRQYESIKTAHVDNIAIGVSAVQAAVRVFTEWFAAGSFALSKTAAKKKEKSVVLQTLQGLLQAQYKKLWSLLYHLLQCDAEAVQSNALHAGMDLVQAEGCSAAMSAKEPAASVSETLLNGAFHGLLRTVMLSSGVAEPTRKEFADTFINQHADLRGNVYVQLKSICNLSPVDFAAQVKEHVSPLVDSAGPAHLVQFLLQSDWKSELNKQWVVLPNTEEEDEDGDDFMAMPAMSSNLSAAALQKLYGDIWIGLLKHKMSVEMYKEILVALHSVIIPALPSPLLLADFLTDSYNIGGIVSLLALNGLFILISKFNLDYPSFFKKLYACCKPYVFHAKYRARFFQLVSLFLTSSYLPSYLVCAFVKRFARLSLTAPPAGAIFCIAIVYNLLRRHPVCRPLINRSLKTAPNAHHAQPVKKGESKAVTEHIPGPLAPVNGGILASLANLLQARQKAVADGTLADPLNDAAENTALRLTLPTYQAPPPSQSLNEGRDPYLMEAEDPEESHAAGSSLWEIKSLTEHFSPTVANLAKVFFTSHAPKKDLEMNKYIEQSYETLFTKETDRRANQKVALQQQLKFGGLFADATESIGLTFQLPATTQPAQINTAVQIRTTSTEDMETDDID